MPCGQLHGEARPASSAPRSTRTRTTTGTRRSALIFFPHLLDRFWQNYRRAIGWKIQYAGAVEMQRRLATHAHYAVRGTVAARV